MVPDFPILKKNFITEETLTGSAGIAEKNKNFTHKKQRAKLLKLARQKCIYTCLLTRRCHCFGL